MSFVIAACIDRKPGLESLGATDLPKITGWESGSGSKASKPDRRDRDVYSACALPKPALPRREVYAGRGSRPRPVMLGTVMKTRQGCNYAALSCHLRT